MNPLIIGPLFELGKNLIERWFPDPEKRAQAEREYVALLQEQEFKKITAQIEVNAKEAASPHLFVAGWRPFVGWACGVGFIYATMGQPFLVWLAAIKGFPSPPAVDTETLSYVLGGMLGLGIYRSVEKIKGVTR